MADLSANPIYVHLARGSRWPSSRGLWRLRAAAGAAGLCLVLIILVVLRALTILIGAWLLILPIAAALLCVAYLSACMVLAALSTARFADAEQLSLIRITGLTGSKLAAGFTEGIQHRLRALEAIGIWLIMGMMTGSILLLAAPVWGAPGPVNMVHSAEVMFIAAWAGIVASAVTGMVLLMVGSMMANLGVWVGLRWPRHAAAAASGALVAGLAASVVMNVGGAFLSSVFGIVTCVLVPAAALSLLGLLEMFAHQDMVGLIDGRVDPSRTSPDA